jgi:hypothetical protein
MKDLTEVAQKVWNARTFEEKAVHIEEMISEFQHKKMQAKFRAEAKAAFSPKELDWLAKNIALADMRVIAK